MSILKEPIITEKMTAKADKLRQYGFIVDKSATKLQIKSAVEKMYEVKVEAISTMVYAGKSKSRFTKRGPSSGRTASFKKAIVTIKEGQAIDFFQNV